MIKPIIALIIPFPACGSANNGSAANTNNKNIKTTDYGTVDWSTAPHGYISFTAVGSERVFVLQGPNGIQDSFTAAKGETIKVSLIDGTGTYQYVIGHSTADKSGYYVDYTNSFTFGKLTAFISDQFTIFFDWDAE